MRQLSQPIKSVDPSRGPIRVNLHELDESPFLLRNGVFVPQGSRDMKAAQSDDLLRQIAEGLETASGDFVKRVIPDGDTMEGVIEGKLMHYGISPVTKKNVNSEKFNNCVAMAMVGASKYPDSDGDELALFAHVSPTVTITPIGVEFVTDMQRRLEEFMDRTRDWSRDVLIAGGNIRVDSPKMALFTAKRHIAVTERLTEIAQRFGLVPTSTAPSVGLHDKYISFETQKRTAHMHPKEGHLVEVPEEVMPPLFFSTETRAHMATLLQRISWEEQ